MSFFGILPTEIIQNHLHRCLELCDIMNLDKSVVDLAREYLLKLLDGCTFRSEHLDDLMLAWVVLRRMNLGKLLVGPIITQKAIHLVREYPYKCEVILDGDASSIERASRMSSDIRSLLTSLDTRRCKYVSNGLIMSLINQGSYLESVRISGSLITKTVLTSLVKWCPLLKVLDVSECVQVSDA